MLLPKKIHLLTFLVVVLFNFSKSTKLEIPELEYLNRSVNPCDNFYEFTCGNFENVKPRPEEMPLWDHFIIMQEKLLQLMKVILESPDESKDPIALTKARRIYSACMNTVYADQLNIPESRILSNTEWPLISQLHALHVDFNWNSIGELVGTYGVQLFFQIEVMPDLFNSSNNIIYISKDKVLNPAIHPYFAEDTSKDFLNDKYLRKTGKHPFEIFLSKVAVKLRNVIGSFKDEDMIINEISEIFNFMKDLQKGGILDDKYNSTTMYQTVDTLQQWTETEVGQINLNWLDYFTNVFSKAGVQVTKDTTIMIMDQKLFHGVLNLIKQTGPALLKDFAMTRIFTYSAPDSNYEISSAYEQYKNDMGYIAYSREDYCTRKVLDYPDKIGFAFALTYQYQKSISNRVKAAEEMLNNLTEAFLDIVTESDWLDDESKANAIEKVNNMITLLGYPNFVKEPKILDRYYENVRVCAWDHFGNSQRLRAFGLASNLMLIGQPRNREVWQLSPLIVNAFYNAQNNRILFPIAMLESPAYTGKFSALDYGRIGMIIGHEITHGFDNQGMQYDANGTLAFGGLWTKETRAEYNKRADCFIEQYGKYLIPEINEYVNPTATLRENIADNGGLREAFKAFKQLKKRSTINSVEGFTPEQLFFIGYGTFWCTSQTDEYMKNKILTSSYPPARFRVNGAISNNEEFSKAFNCPTGSNMNPANKCVLW